jgi:FixJ family two-component response regulator
MAEIPCFANGFDSPYVVRALPYDRASDFLTQILVVTAEQTTSDGVVNLLKTQGYGVSSACGFKAASQALSDHAPRFLISELRLGAFNALHLAIRHRDDNPGMQTIVLDSVHDVAIEREAQREGALYFVEPIDASQLLDQISVKLAHDGPPRRWPRTLPARALRASVAHRAVRIVDLSYGGVRLEAEAEEGAEFPPVLDLFFAEIDVTVRVALVWTRPASRGWTRCGAELCDDNPQHVASWRRLVDSASDRETRTCTKNGGDFRQQAIAPLE